MISCIFVLVRSVFIMEEPAAPIVIVAVLKINSAGSRRHISEDNNIPFITHSFYTHELLAARLTLNLDWHHFVVLDCFVFFVAVILVSIPVPKSTENVPCLGEKGQICCSMSQLSSLKLAIVLSRYDM